MGDALERLTVKLAATRVWVPPHMSVSAEGKPYHVKGYWRHVGRGPSLVGGPSQRPMMKTDVMDVLAPEAVAEPDPPDVSEAPEAEPFAMPMVEADTPTPLADAVDVQDQREYGPPLRIDKEKLQALMETVGVKPEEGLHIRLRIRDQKVVGDQGSTVKVNDHEWRVVIKVADKPELLPKHIYVINNSMLHEFRHVRQEQDDPEMTAKYHQKYGGTPGTEGYATNPYELEARAYGRLADHTGEKPAVVPPEAQGSEALLDPPGDLKPTHMTGEALWGLEMNSDAEAPAPAGGAGMGVYPKAPSEGGVGGLLGAIIQQIVGGGGGVQGPPVEPAKPKSKEDAWFDGIVSAAKTVNYHQGDKEYNEAKIANLQKIKADMEAELPTATGDEAQRIGTYLAYIDEILAAKDAGTKTPNKKYTKWTPGGGGTPTPEPTGGNFEPSLRVTRGEPFEPGTDVAIRGPGVSAYEAVAGKVLRVLDDGKVEVQTYEKEYPIRVVDATNLYATKPGTTLPAASSGTVTPSGHRPLYEIAGDIYADLQSQNKAVPYGAVPYLDALKSLNDIKDAYFADDAFTVVSYLIGNLAQWRGPKAKEIKAELKAILKRR